MPIYAYRCNDCGFQKDHLQKLSDAPIAVCPSCSSSHYGKQLSAPGFQLKGSGWYATDFKGGNNASCPLADTSSSTSDASSAPAGCGGGCACHPAAQS